jgi:hypothetical protein
MSGNKRGSVVLRLSLLTALVVAASGSGCASEREPISRVQPNALNKHFFIGEKLGDSADDPEFRWRNYVVGASVSQSLIGVGSWGHVDRIRWEVTENLLIARKAYESPGSTGGDDRQPRPDGTGDFVSTTNGTVVAVYRILSHFDIRRAYNTATGEELNVLEENSSDRAWNDREYMRIDWSQNLVANNPMWNEIFTGSVFGNLSVTPVAYAVTDPTSDDAVHIDPEAGYLDITNKYYVDPARTASPFSDLSGQVPACIVYGIYTGSGTYECDAQEATVRSSYMRISPDEDFESLENTKATLDVVGNPGGIGDSFSIGIVNAGRQKWDPQYGFTDALYHRFANIHNTWKQSHQKKGDKWVTCNANVDADKNGTADQCENGVTGYAGSTGSQCDIYQGKCTIPYRDREIKTVTYWVNKETPADLLDPVDGSGKPTGLGTMEDLTHSWDQLLSAALAFAKEVECRRTGGGDRDSCHAQFFDSTSDPKTKTMVSYGGWLVDKPKAPAKGTAIAMTLCHNPVRDYDLHEACGKTGETARVGDIRKNFIFYWPYESRAPWGGIANWEADPLTGEIIGGAAQIMGRSATFAAAMQRDIIQLALGDLKIEDIIENTPAATYAKTLQDGRTPALTEEEIASRLKGIDTAKLKLAVAAEGKAPSSGDKLTDYLQTTSKMTTNPTQVSTALLEYESLAKKLRGTPMEAQIVDSHWLVDAIGAKPSTLGETALEVASPIRGLDPGRMRAMHAMIEEGLHNKGVCFLENEAPVSGSVYIPGAAGWFKAKYGSLTPKERGEKIYQDLWKEAVKGIALHEIGHSLGMLHQFASSWDAPNYNPQYWQLRTNEGKATASCAGKPRPMGEDSCMGPRYLDPMTADEAGLGGEPRPGIEYFGNTSTMEYQLERFGETVGLGTYDYHTMKTLYARVLETFDDKDMPLMQQQAFRYLNYTQLTERDIIPISSSKFYTHYTETARRMKVFNAERDCRPATEEEKAVAGWRIVHGKVCSPPPKDHWAWRDFKSDAIQPGLDGVYWHTGTDNTEKKERIRWHYRWGTTHNAYFHTNDSDAGADVWEVVQNTIKRFEMTYPWTYFRRKNREYYYKRIPSQTSDRYFERMRSFHWLIATSIGRGDDAGINDDNELRPYALAEKDMFNMLVKSALMPEPGAYGASGPRTPVESLKPIFDTGGSAFNINIGDGRFIGEDYNNELGGSWDYIHWINHAGFSVEKASAMQALVDGRPTLFTISRENFLDGRGVKINFRTDMAAAVDRIIGGILSEDWESVAPHVLPGDRNPVPQVIDYNALAPTRPAGASILFPNIGYKQQVAASMFTALFSRLNSDMTLINKMRVWLEGATDAISIPDEQAAKFTDPTSGYTYVARKYGPDTIDGKTVDKGVASRMIAHANALAAAAYKVKMDGTGKPMIDKYGRPTLETNAAGEPEVADSERAAELTRYVGLIDSVREIGYRLGYGPLGGTGTGVPVED